MSKFINSKCVIIVVLFLILSFVFSFSSENFDDKSNDFFTKIFYKITPKHHANNVVLVAVDDISIDKIDWPWDRNLFSDIFKYLDDYAHAKVIVFQNLVVFPNSYNPKSDTEFYREISHNKKLINSFIFMNSSVAGDVLRPEYLDVFNQKNNVNIIDKRSDNINSPYKAVINLPKDFLYSANNLASSILIEDKDEILRQYMPVVQMQNQFYPSIALSAYSLYTGINDFVLYDNYLCSIDNCKTLKMPIDMQINKDVIGNTVQGLFTKIKWYSPLQTYYLHKKYSAIDVLNSYKNIKKGMEPIISPSEFKDKIVIIGLNADKNVWEQLSETPILKKQADIDVHATVIDNMLSNSFINFNREDATLLITSIFSLFVIFGFRSLKNNLIFAVLLSLIYFSYYVVQFYNNILIPPITPILTIILVCFLKSVYLMITTDKSFELVKRAMGKYISKDVMKKVLSDLDKLKLGGARAVVTILFVDIRNFTQISENLSPQDVTSILNEYFSLIEPIIAKYNGIINKYMGDGVLAVFGEPIKDENHSLSAIKCGIEIREKVAFLREKLLEEGKPKIEIGIGINTGEVFAGNIGTEERLEYTVIGDNVNLAYRIESYNQLLKTNFLISQYTYEYVKDYVEVVKLSSVEIKGKSKPIDIYEILKIKDGK